MDAWMAAYWFCTVVGGGLLVISALSGVGGSDVDVASDADLDLDFDGDADVDLELDAEGHIDLESSGLEVHDAPSVDAAGAFWLPFLSVRFWIFLMAGFGLTGVVLSSFTERAALSILAFAVVVGLLFGVGGAWAFRAIRKSGSVEAAQPSDFLGKRAKVLVAARGKDLGKVRVQVDGEDIDLLALAESGGSVESGEEVFVVGLEEGRARVMRAEDILETRD